MITEASKTVLISGGAGGIGSAIAVAAAARGAYPIVGYFQNEEQAAEVVRRCGCGRSLHMDLRKPDLDLREEIPDVDAVAHCAGAITNERTIVGATPTEVYELLGVNALGPLWLTQRILERSNKLQRVLFVLSTSIVCLGSGPYAVSKLAAFAVAKLLALELKPRHIRVDALVPGWTDTAMAQRAARAAGRSLDQVKSEHPHGRILDPSDVGELCADLLLEERTDMEPKLVWWDKRVQSEPLWQDLLSVPVFGKAMEPGGD